MKRIFCAAVLVLTLFVVLARPHTLVQGAALAPQTQAPTGALVDPDIVGPWTWVFGKQINYTYEQSIPTLTVEFNMNGFYVQCQSAQYRFDDNHYSFIAMSPAADTHWRNYTPYGTLSGSKHLKLSMGWFIGKVGSSQLEDALNPNRYLAQCRTY